MTRVRSHAPKPYGQNCRAEHTLRVELVSGAQHIEVQSVVLVQMNAHEPPFVPTHVFPAQQSSGVMHAAPDAEHVLEQNPRGAQAIIPVFCSGAQQPDLHCEPAVHLAAQKACAPGIVVGTEQIPEQQAFGVLVQSVDVGRHDDGAPASTTGCWPVSSGPASISAPPPSPGILGPPRVSLVEEHADSRTTMTDARTVAHRPCIRTILQQLSGHQTTKLGRRWPYSSNRGTDTDYPQWTGLSVPLILVFNVLQVRLPGGVNRAAVHIGLEGAAGLSSSTDAYDWHAAATQIIAER